MIQLKNRVVITMVTLVERVSRRYSPPCLALRKVSKVMKKKKNTWTWENVLQLRWKNRLTENSLSKTVTTMARVSVLIRRTL